jgi:cell wall assembly regulator SMI1
MLYFDADPAPRGSRGQIITYQHDPDAIRFAAPSLLDFIRQSNSLLEKHAAILLADT